MLYDHHHHMVVVDMTLPGVVTGKGALATGAVFARVGPFWLIAAHIRGAKASLGVQHGGGGGWMKAEKEGEGKTPAKFLQLGLCPQMKPLMPFSGS
jgi:hypothetical protein